jgi:hypothetical protein
MAEISNTVASSQKSSDSPERQKTLFIIVDSGLSIRNILRTNVFKILRSTPNLRIVIFSPITDEEFRKEMAGENIIIEPLQKWKPNPIVKSLRSYRKDLWSEQHELVRFREKRASRKERWDRALLRRLFLKNGGRSGIDHALRKVEKWERRWTPKLCAHFFEKYQPDLVFYTTIYSKDPAVELAAAQRGIPSVAFILSWDNPTTKGPFPVHPDYAIVWNDIMRDELLKFHEIRPDQLYVAGPPQFDIYTDYSDYKTRDEFFAFWGLDPKKRLITYTTGSVGMLPLEHQIVELLYQKVRSGAFKEPTQLMVRLHPKDVYEPYRKFERQPGLVLQSPGRKADTLDSWNPTPEDMFGLAETMRYSDVVVNIASTTTIDAACFDTPVVNVAFDGLTSRPYEKSCRRYYKFDHYKKIVETGGIKIANSLDEAVQCIQAYFDDPSQEAEGRERIRQEQCFKLDGKAGERIARFVLKVMNAKTHQH